MMLRFVLNDKIENQIISVVTVLVLVWLASFIAKGTAWRRRIRQLQAQGLPMPPHSLIFGHLPVLIKMLGRLPSNAHPLYMPEEMRRNYPELGPNYYMDLWPVAPSMLVISTPETVHQITNQHVLQKHPNLKKYLRPLTDALDIVTMEGATWKKWRAVFNPGFSATHLMTLVPLIVRETETYCMRLDEHAVKQDIFEMKKLTDNLTFDIIGRIVLNVRFNAQGSANRVVHSIRTLINWLSFGIETNPFDRNNPFRPLVHWYHSRIINSYVSKEVDSRFSMQQDRISEGGTDPKSTRTVIDLALNAYNESLPQDQTGPRNAAMDPFFRKVCVSQLKLFLFSGHDTTSSAICFHLYLLSQHPYILSRVQDEHTSVFGTELSQTAEVIKQSPHLLNRLPYTTAVIKESLRIFPTVTGSRMGEVGFSITDNLGRSFPTADFLIWPNQHTLQNNPTFWVEPQSFKPERFLVGPDDPLYPKKGAWRPFEQGPRTCIAQELAMIEMKTVLVLTARNFVFRPTYDELDALKGTKQPMVHGEKAYQVELMQPRGNLPTRVEKL